MFFSFIDYYPDDQMVFEAKKLPQRLKLQQYVILQFQYHITDIEGNKKGIINIG